MTKILETATLGAGCFWGVESWFMELDGVVETSVGYMGGHLPNPTYQDVCTDKSGHAEVLQIIFDPEKIAYEKLLDHFWQMHDPTQWNRQGPDFGTQYRSVIFYHTEYQKEIAFHSKTEMQQSGKFSEPVVTAIEKATVFWKAEEYHQKYHQKHGIGGCHIG